MLACVQRLRPPLPDTFLALTLIAVAEAEVVSEHLRPYWASVPGFALSMGVLAWRRRAPLYVVAISFGATLLGAAAGVSQHKPFSPIFAIFVALYSLALYASPRRALLGLGYAAGCLYLQIALAMHHGESYGGTDFGFIAVVLLAPWLVGKALRGRVPHMAVLERRAENGAGAGAARRRGGQTGASSDCAGTARRDRPLGQRHGGAGERCRGGAASVARTRARPDPSGSGHRPPSPRRDGAPARHAPPRRGRTRARTPTRPRRPLLAHRADARSRPPSGAEGRRNAYACSRRCGPFGLPDRAGGADQHAKARRRTARDHHRSLWHRGARARDR